MSLRILHTADWHLGDRLGNQDRLGDQFDRLQEIADSCREHDVDILLVAGDVIDEHRSEQLSTIVSRLAELLRPCIDDGLHCIFLAGNHDREHVFDLLRGVQDLLGPQAKDRPQLTFLAGPKIVELTGRDGTRAVLLALPYPTVGRYDVGTVNFDNHDARHATLGNALANTAKDLRARADTEHPKLPVIIAAHLLVGGVSANTGAREISDAQDITLDPAHLSGAAYVALGHVHQPHEVAPNAWYSGSLERMDHGEADDDKRAVLAEIDPAGALTMTMLELDATPFATIDVGSTDELEEQVGMLADPQRTLVRLTVRIGRDDDLGALLALARRRLPRLHQHAEVLRLDDPLPMVSQTVFDPHAVSSTVRRYLDEQIPAGDPDRDALLALAEELLADQPGQGAG